MTTTKKMRLTERGCGLHRTLGSVVIFLLLCFGPVSTVLAEDNPLLSAARDFMALIDDGQYQRAWWEGGELFHQTSELDPWVDSVRVQREMFGKFRERSLKTLTRRSSLPGFPDGEYVIMAFDCRYEFKQMGLELLSLGQDPYGGWRVISYALR